MTAHATDPGTADRILDVAEALAQRRGFNGFSYAHIAAELGVTKASLHYHFASKTQLGEALIARYSARFSKALDEIDRRHADAMDKLVAYTEIYSGVLRGQRMCLCGMLAAEYETLPGAMGEQIVRFFDTNRIWLTQVLSDGQASCTLVFDGPAGEGADAILAGLEGALLVARPYRDPARFDSAARRLLASFAREPATRS